MASADGGLGTDLLEVGQVAWRRQLESQVSAVAAPNEGEVFDKLLKGAPTEDMETQWQVIQHAIVKVAETSPAGARLDGGKLRELV